MAKNRFSCKTQMAFTTSKLASSKAPKVRAIAQDTLFKKLFLNSSDFHLVSLFVSSSPSNRQRISKNKNVYYSRIFKYSSRAPSPTGRRGFRRNLVCSGGVVLDIQFKLKRLYGSSSCSQLHVKRSWIMRSLRRDVDVDLDLDLKFWNGVYVRGGVLGGGGVYALLVVPGWEEEENWRTWLSTADVYTKIRK